MLCPFATLDYGGHDTALEPLECGGFDAALDILDHNPGVTVS